MIIYADILIFSNIVIDYILLVLTTVIMKIQYKLFRLVIASIIGGFSSIYIFYQTNSILLDVTFKTVVGFVMILIVFNKSKVKQIVISFIIFLILSFGFNGLILFLQNLRLNNFVSKNLVSYIDISPIILIILSIVFYLFIRFIQKYLSRKNSVDTATVIIELLNRKITLNALIDSGHTLTDPFSDSQIIIIDLNFYKSLNFEALDLSNRKRLIPVKTITDDAVLDGIRCDKATVMLQEKCVVLEKPIILASQQSFLENYNAIISYSAVNAL